MWNTKIKAVQKYEVRIWIGSPIDKTIGYIVCVCTNLMVQVSRIQGHEIRIVLYAHLDNGDLFF